MKCQDCKLDNYWCICSQVDEFFKDNKEIMEDLAEIEEQEKGRRRCNACFFFICRCGSGHNSRLQSL